MRNKIVTVIKREYMARVKSKGFIVSLFLLPVLICGFVLLSSFLSIMTEKDKEMEIVVIDETLEIFAQMPKVITGRDHSVQSKEVHVYELIEGTAATEAVEAELRRLVNTKALYAYLVIPKDVFENGDVRLYTRAVTYFGVQRELERIISDIVRNKRFADRSYSQREVSQLMRSPIFITYTVKSSKGNTGGTEVEWAVETSVRIRVGYMRVFVLYIFVIIYANSIMRSVLEEKTTRIVEVIVSSIKPYQLLLGKLVGVCSACLTMFAISMLFGIVLIMSITPLLPLSGFGALLVEDFIKTVIAGSAEVFPYFFIYFIIGFFMYSTLYAVVGAMCSSEEEAQQIGALLTVLIVVTFILMFLLFRITPDSTLIVLLSHVPFFSPILMFMRINVLMPPLWEILLNVLVVCATVLLVTLISGKIYRVGILMYGKRPTLGQLWQWARY